MTRDKIIWMLIIVLDIIIVQLIPNTYDDGDSILHFIQAQQAYDIPNVFLDMWAKPIFILIAAPFAQFGWIGMKLFNSLCMLGAAYFTKHIAEHINLNGWMAVFFCFAAYSFVLIQSSGLTEPLFTLALILIIWLLFKEKYISSTLLLSILPFIRSEGYIVILIITVYLLVKHKFKVLPLLLTGTVVYGLVGLIFLQDFLWMFHNNPYSGIEVKYGNGDALYYLDQIPYLIGLPTFILVFLGVMRAVILFSKGQLSVNKTFLVYGIAIGYFVAHSIFWTNGWFHSFGMTRVMVVIIPLFAIIALDGLDWIRCAFGVRISKWLTILILAYSCVFPFTNNVMALNWKKQIDLSQSQKLIVQAHNWVQTSQYNNKPTYTNAYYYVMLTGRLLDDNNNLIRMEYLTKKNYVPHSGSLVVWDSYFSRTDATVKQKYLNSLGATMLKSFESNGYKVSIYLLP